MKCRFCNAKIAKNDSKCPSCKKDNPQPQRERFFASKKRAAITIGSLAVLVVLAISLFVAMMSGWNLSDCFAGLTNKENNIYYKNNYTVSDRVLAKHYQDVIATMGDGQMTNELLQIYYWRQVYEFVGNYESSLSSLGLDYTGNMAKQDYIDGSSSWQQYFLESAVQMWRTNYAFAVLAEENGYELPEEYSDLLNNIHERLEKAASDSGYSGIEEMLLTEIGPGCTEEMYAQYLQTYYYGYLYFREVYNALEPTEEEIEAHFAANEEDYAASGITKDGSVYVSFRHIMIFPENAALAPDGSMYYTDEAWDACLGAAEAVMDRWKAGGRTEEVFTELVSKYSQDETTYLSGGLYSNVVQGDLMDSVDAWCFDAARKNGDCAIIKSDYGYHIVYFIESEEIWHATSRSALQEEMGKVMVDEVLSNYTFVVDYSKIVLGKPKFSK